MGICLFQIRTGKRTFCDSHLTNFSIQFLLHLLLYEVYMNAIKIDTPLEYSIAVTEFLSDNPNANCVIIASATGVKQNYYQNFSKFLSKNNYSVFTFDYGGIGDSKIQSLSKFSTTASNWAQNDFESVVKHVKNKNPNSKLFIITHSIGGQLIGLVPSNNLFDGVIMVASQSGSWIHWKGFDRLKMKFLWYVIIPSFCRIFNYLPSSHFTRMEDLPKGMALEWAKWCKKPNYHFDSIENVKESYDKIKCQIKSYSIDNDFYATVPAINWIVSQFKNAEVTRTHLKAEEFGVKDIGHFGFFKKIFKESIWELFLKDLRKFEN
ncbi:Hydrolase_4 domain-containing protein [Flavobacterium collinsii]|uniref:Hydrolase_4 domain-containing protein n=2 Tax=Flavobacterium collinsii TaxID=1114861 RepID=A0A9W4XBX9_9FLAO|nr:Hydrolase_4 domain-containing protein [Flavobacterium collinsii]